MFWPNPPVAHRDHFGPDLTEKCKFWSINQVKRPWIGVVTLLINLDNYIEPVWTLLNNFRIRKLLLQLHSVSNIFPRSIGEALWSSKAALWWKFLYRHCWRSCRDENANSTPASKTWPTSRSLQHSKMSKLHVRTNIWRYWCSSKPQFFCHPRTIGLGRYNEA